MEHTVRKSKKNRIALRITASLFLIVGILRLIAMVIDRGDKSPVLTILIIAACLMYGIILMLTTFKPQAYDITYVFGDKQFTMKMHKKEITYDYADITDLGYVVPNPNMEVSIVQIFIGKEQFTIPFNNAGNLGEALYGMLKMKREGKA